MLISNEDFKKVIDNLHDEIMIYDNNYKLVYLNKASVRHYGIEPEDLIGKKFSDLDETFWGNSTLPEVYEYEKTVAKRQVTNKGIDIVTISSPVFNENSELKYVGQNVNDIYLLDEFQNQCFNSEIDKDDQFIYKSSDMEKIISTLNKIKNIKSTCLILGETGTGKSYLVNYIHKTSIFKDKPLVSLNCACMNQSLIESELFGYEGGAFTGASNKGKMGLVEVADGGVLFLDEISEMPLELQAKLLQFIQNQEFIPIGGNKKKKVDVKIVAASNRSLSTMVEQNAFRRDLYFRLNTFELILSPLRERKEDIRVYIDYFIDKFNNKYFRKCSISQDAVNILINYSWPGNIRELEHVLEKAVVLSKHKKISIGDLPKRLFEIKNIAGNINIENGDTLKDIMESVEEKVIRESYTKHQNSVKVAKELGISQPKAYRLIKKYILSRI